MQNPIIQQVVETLRGANNVLITVKNSPSVDELTASIALTLILNHMNKHATTVFSGHVPSTIEFLQPEMAIETTTDSLRDFIIALDKAKADKLRYKVENDVVRIFITPYRSSISEQDLEFSQGDFNVDVVVALGVLNKDDFDHAILEHGRILHDATVIAINNQAVPNEVGAISWHDEQASSVSEMVASITELFGQNVLDGQIATALMTGIVAETDRFKNTKTTPQVLSISSNLMAAGANQQLIAEELEKPPTVVHAADIASSGIFPPTADDADDGTLSVPHDSSESVKEIEIDEHGNMNISGQSEKDVSPLTKIQHDIGLEATMHTENDDVKDVVDQLPDTLPALEQEESEQEPPSLVENRPFLSPSHSDENEQPEFTPPAEAESSGLLGNIFNKVKSSTRREEQPPSVSNPDVGIRTKKPKTIKPLDSYVPNLDFQDNMPLFKASEPTDPVAEPQALEMRKPIQDTEADPTTKEQAAAVEEPALPLMVPKQPEADDSGHDTALLVPAPEEGDKPEEKTLAQIEQDVQSPHLDNNVPTFEPHLAEVNEPVGAAGEFPTELPPVQIQGPSVEDAHDNVPAQSPYMPPDYSSGNPVDGTAAPIVPPPIMPQAGDSNVPQFFEADGKPSKPLANQN